MLLALGGGHIGDLPAVLCHLRELRARIIKVALILAVGFAVALVFYDQLFDLVYRPYLQAQKALGSGVTEGVTQGVAGGFMFYLKLSGVAAVMGTAPLWLYQIWAFILPGLHSHERKWSRVFAAIAGPLFVLGVVTGYYVLPRGLEVLIGFTPGQLENLVEFGEYFSFFTRMLLVFGVAFEIPLFVVLLNLAGVLRGATLTRYRSWIIVGTFIFAAVATPSTDPFSMLMLAIPMTVLFLISEVVARLVDRRRHREATTWADDEASPIDGPSSVDE